MDIKIKEQQMKKMKIAFICVHNSCRSQMAEAITKKIASDIFESYSAGTQLVDNINQDAIKTIKDIYDYDMSQQYSKLIEDLPVVDIVITMGCNVVCPTMDCNYREDWGLDDPTGKSEDVFIETARSIEDKLKRLISMMENK